jgi:hypothetical protein
MFDVSTTGDTAHIYAILKYVPPLPRDLADLKARIIAAAKNIDAPMLTRVWQELEYRIDVGRVRGRWGDPDVDGRIILRLMFRKWEVVVGLAQDRDRWRALVSTVKNPRVP